MPRLFPLSFLPLLALLTASAAELPDEAGRRKVIQPAVHKTFAPESPRPEAEMDPALEAWVAKIESVMAEVERQDGRWGLRIESLDRGQVLYDHNANESFVPASNQKLFVTAAALTLLGPEFRYETHLEATARPDAAGTVHGDLVVVGSGDPSFTPRFQEGDALAPFRAWARALTEAGVRRVSGDLVGDDNAFDDRGLAEGWAERYLSSWYAAESGALALNDNCLDLELKAGDGDIGDPLALEILPAPGFGTIDNQTRVAPRGQGRGVSVHREPGSNVYQIRGTLSHAARPRRLTITVHNPTAFFTGVLKTVLESEGIRIDGAARDIDTLADPARLEGPERWRVATHQSPTLLEIVRATNKKSQNLYSEQLLKTLGQRLGGEGSHATGARALRSFLEMNGIDTRGLEAVDGSGLSPLNRVSPAQLTGLLRMMAGHPHYDYFLESLPVAGRDGSLRHRMDNSLAENRVRAKTGHIRHTATISGYATTVGGERLVFSLMTNDIRRSSWEVNQRQDRVCAAIVSLERPPDAADPAEAASLPAEAGSGDS